MQDISTILKQYWGYTEFRPLQKEIITSVLEGKDTLALLPTGGGKSICFQIPALAQDGLCLIVSPLIALMKDQVENLKKRGILALVIYSGMSRRLIIQTLKNAASGNFKFLYVSPERLETSLFLEYLPALNISLIAVDEAHCISQWGYDFRPSYLRISALRSELQDVPVLALTASATEEVQSDIFEKLQFKTKNIFRQSFERKNLSYSVFNVDSKISRLVEIITKVEGTAIVYCKSRKRTTEIASLLQMHNISSQCYHAGLEQKVRTERQQAWIENKVKVMVCTNAFGMGIDKPDVRLVLHIDIPDCLENYYQEAGRAGRDEKKAYAVLLYDEKDLIELETLHQTRFPSFDQIKQVYHSLCNYLQIPIYTGENVSYTFRFKDFITNFKLDSNTTLYALKALEGDGWMDVNEKNFTPSTVVFTTSKYLLQDFEKGYSEYEPLLTTMLRTYEGIFDFPANISEIVLAKLLRKDEAYIKKSLKYIASFGIINYTPENDEPQIIFRKNRVAADELTLNLSQYNKRKELFIKRVQKIIKYATATTCRSIFINQYFGDESSKACGICDNCLKKKSTALSSEEFKKISNFITIELQQSPLNIHELLLKLKDVNKEKARSVLNFLQAEQKISVNQQGRIFLC